MKRLALLLLPCVLAACAGLTNEPQDDYSGLGRELNPVSQNWSVSDTRLAEDRYRIALVQKRWHTGGDGEAILLFRRHAQAMVESGGYSRYVIARYEESLDSNWLVQRSAQGEVILQR